MELVSGHPRPTRVRVSVYRGCPAGTHWGDDPSRQDDEPPKRQLLRVSCGCVLVRRAACTR